MTKAFKLNWRVAVQEELQKGCVVGRWTEVRTQAVKQIDSYKGRIMKSEGAAEGMRRGQVDRGEQFCTQC